MKIKIFHWCLVRSRSFAADGSFVAGLFNFLSRRPIVNWLRAIRSYWHTDLDFLCISKCMGLEQLPERGLFCIKTIFLCICDPCACIW